MAKKYAAPLFVPSATVVVNVSSILTSYVVGERYCARIFTVPLSYTDSFT